jgi:hypothetical protein
MADAVQKLVDQILAQGTSGKWTGEGFGGAEKNARDMAKMFSDIGITDIKQFGKIKTPAQDTGGPAKAVAYPNDPNDPSKGYYTFEHVLGQTDEGPGIVRTENKIPVDPNNIKKTPVIDWDNGGIETGEYTLETTTPVYEETFGNKATNQPLVDPNKYDRRGGNIFSGTYTGKDQTQFGVQFRDDGTPVFYTQAGPSTSNAGEIMQIAGLGLSLFAPGIGGAIGSALTGTASTTLISKVVGAAIVKGTMAELSGGSFKDGAISGAIGAGLAPVVSNTIGTAVAEAMGDSAFNKVVTNAVTSASTAGLTAGLTGKGDVLDSALNAAVASIGSTYGKELGGDTGAKIGTALGKIATGADAEQVLTSTIMDTLKSTVTGALKEDGKGKGKGKDQSGGGDEDDAIFGGAGDDSVNDLLGLAPTEVGDRGAVESVSVGGDDPLLGLSSAEVGQGEIDAITGAGATGDDSTEGGVSTDTTGADAGTETKTVTTGPMGPKTEDQTRREKDEFGRYLDYMRDGEPDPPKYGVQDLGVTDENFKSFDENLKKMLDDGNLPTQWKPGADGTFTFTGDDGDTLTIDADGKILGSTDAPKGNLLSDTVTDPLVTKPVTTTGAGTTNTATTNTTTTKAADTSSGFDLLSLLALMGGEQKPVEKKQEVNNDPFVAFDFNRPFQVNPFAQNTPTPRMAEGGSIDELLELLQYRGQT